jgi:hypothetical protein
MCDANQTVCLVFIELCPACLPSRAGRLTRGGAAHTVSVRRKVVVVVVEVVVVVVVVVVGKRCCVSLKE